MPLLVDFSIPREKLLDMIERTIQRLERNSSSPENENKVALYPFMSMVDFFRSGYKVSSRQKRKLLSTIDEISAKQRKKQIEIKRRTSTVLQRNATSNNLEETSDSDYDLYDFDDDTSETYSEQEDDSEASDREEEKDPVIQSALSRHKKNSSSTFQLGAERKKVKNLLASVDEDIDDEGYISSMAEALRYLKERDEDDEDEKKAKEEITTEENLRESDPESLHETTNSFSPSSGNCLLEIVSFFPPQISSQLMLTSCIDPKVPQEGIEPGGFHLLGGAEVRQQPKGKVTKQPYWGTGNKKPLP